MDELDRKGSPRAARASKQAQQSPEPVGKGKGAGEKQAPSPRTPPMITHALTASAVRRVKARGAGAPRADPYPHS